MRQKRPEIAAVVVTALILTTTTSWATSNIDVWELFFARDVSSAQQHAGLADIAGPDPSMLPVKEVAEALGGDVSYGLTGRNAVLRYRGVTLEIWAGEEFCGINGERVEFGRGPVACFVNREALVVDSYVIQQCFQVDIAAFLAGERTEGVVI